MDDLSGLNWSAPDAGKKPAQTVPASANPAANFYPSLRPTPSPLPSGRNTPLSAQGSGTSGLKGPASKAAQDSFSNLLNFGTGKSNANLTLRERQEQLEAEKRRKEEERLKQTQANFGGQFLDSLGQNSSGSFSSLRAPSPAIAPPPPPPSSGSGQSFGGIKNAKSVAESDDDLFAAFNASTKVDNSSHYPPPPSSSHTPSPAPGLDLSNPGSWSKPAIPSSGRGFEDDLDDDPFGLNQLKPKASASRPPPPIDDEDDLLGDLGKPVDQVRKKVAPTFAREPEPGKAIEDSDSDSSEEQPQPTPTAASDDPFDKAVAQLVDYGFTPENARRGLTESGAGLNVQAAVNWLLDDAHRKSKEKAKAMARSGATREQSRDGGERASSQSRNGGPAWMREGPPSDGTRSRDNQSPASMDADFAKTAAAVGTSLFKTANSLWKTGQKKVQKAVAEFQQEGDPNQPKWMRSAQEHAGGGDTRRQVPDVTDEAAMLEGGDRPPRKQGRSGPESRTASNAPSRDRSPALPVRPSANSQAPKWQQASQPSLDPRARIGRQAAEEESFQAYVSPARRKKATPQPQPEIRRAPEPEEDLLFGGSAAPPRSRPTPPSRSAQPSPAPRPASRQAPAPRPIRSRPPRQIPDVSAIALQSSTKYRLEGTAHFKRGDYAAAHTSYANSLAAIPQDHPLAILLLCNRSLTALKTGEPKQAVDDADTAIKLIGAGKGEGEHVEVQGESGSTEKRDMRELYGKALSRKAEGLEQMEKWTDALAVWQLCVESGLGGATAAAGRQRCQKALAPKPAPRPASARPTAAPIRPRPTPSISNGQKSAEAVHRLREANKAAEREGDEKIALTDKVEARIAAWRDGKKDNLRALLSSLDNVLWEGSGWKKVGLHELVMANKVKIIYMKAIAKTHPDKIAQDATTEVRMVAGHVFSTLNEAWDKFKAENKL
ncbi:hypothetical protein QBC35DRAFT_486880 [Podospora australis]|uniref:UBA domain-containing protein n=1 Tax=Podospora australis TaxID=1536484 RepID=A0AAN6X1U7_9PEZI|nr:hypothetical protein QBC35DRAFT_486880 [Podospora australis]